MKKISLFLLTLPVSTIATLAPLTIAVAQQVTPDGTVSTTVITPDGKNFNINDGTTRGTNLFHSFKEFSVPTGGSATFNNAANIQNIISRVTGGSVSSIDGLIRTLGKANLFLLNPAGIIFGPNAQLNIGGSFLGSTANSFLFDNGFEFSATDPQAPPLLTITAPIGLSYRENFKNITSQSAGLQVPQGNSFALVGGNVSLNGGILFAPGGRIELGGLSAPGTVGLNGDGSLSFPVGVQRADVSLTNGAIAYVQGGGGGNIAVNARNLDLLGGSILYGGIQSGLGTPGAQAGDIKIDATDRVRIQGTTSSRSGILNSTGNFSSNSSNITEPGNAGNIIINTGTLEGNGSILIGSLTNGEGNAGKIIITAKDKVSLTGDANNFAYVGGIVGSSGTGNGADVVIDTPSFSLFNAAIQTSTSGQGNAGNIQLKVSESISLAGVSQLQANTSGRGNAGNVTVSAGGKISFDGRGSNLITGILSYVAPVAEGNAGNINISGQSVSLNDATVTTSSAGQGNAGNIFVQAQDTISLANNSLITNNVGSPEKQPAKGNVGNIVLDAKEISLKDGAQLQGGLYSGAQGNPGIVSVQARDSISFVGKNTGIFTDVEFGAKGNGSDIQILAPSVSFKDGAVLKASNAGQGNAGNILVQAQDTISAENSFILSNVGSRDEAPAKGNVGNIVLDAKEISLKDGAQLQAGLYSGAQGNPGIVSVQARDSISFVGKNSGIFTDVEFGAKGNGSDIQISAPSVSFKDSAILKASNAGQGNGGNIAITADSLLFDNSLASSRVEQSGVGNAGSIDFNARSLSLTNGGAISTSNVGNGTAGNITVTTAKDIRLDNKAFIEANTNGGQGNITLNSGDLILRRNSNITTNATGTATGGNININTGNLVALENSKITANAQQGYGGNIIITTKGGRFLSPDSVISATSEAGPQFSGTVQFNTPQNDPSRGLFEFPETVTDPAQQIAQNVCTKSFGSSFVITGRGGVPTDPKKILSSDNVRVDLVKPVASTVNSTSTTQKQPSQQPTVKKIIPAQGWIFNEKGEVLLVGYDPTKTGVQRPQPAPNSSCAAVK
ncbi:filamentous hemagglutinin N-terminal domain-containing protein [Scytonema tolypothrichoides VB-61278]|nr:filamentous hemagglutinin N-terminal domain-containing protein [Scytonema tolypothrichoides VB-61278]